MYPSTVGVSPLTSSLEMISSSPASPRNCTTGVVGGIGVVPAVPPAETGDFCLMFCAPESIVSRTDRPVARCRTVTIAGNGNRRYFQLARGLESAWLAVNAMDHEKSGIVFLLWI